jgi:hypothetical protein
MASSSAQPNGVWPMMSRLYPGIPLAMSAQPGMTASNCPFSSTAAPSPSSNQSTDRLRGSSGGRPPGCLVCAAGMTGARPEFSRPRSVVGGAASWLAIQVAAMGLDSSFRYAAVVIPSHSTVMLRLS